MTSGTLNIAPSTGGATAYSWNPGTYGIGKLYKFNDSGAWIFQDK